MVGIGKAYKNLMVDVQPSNEKLISRAINIVMQATGVEEAVARKKMEESEGNVKAAILMILLDIDKETAEQKLVETKGHIRQSL